jgi:hypothetical protein
LTVGTNISVEEITVNRFQLYPNPANDLVQLRFESEHPGGWLEIYDAQGKRVEAIWLNGIEQQHTLQLGEWAAGLYLVRFGPHQERLLISR